MNMLDEDGSTALHHACGCGDSHKELVGLLLAHKDIDVNLTDQKNSTPFMKASSVNVHEIMELLSSHKDIDEISTVSMKGWRFSLTLYAIMTDNCN